MNAWRLTRPEYAATALAGEGSARYPGRWNPRGLRVIYASETLSLATLEVLAHAEDLEALNGYVALKIELPADSLTTLSLAELPADWQDSPAPDSTRRLGLAWYQKQEMTEGDRRKSPWENPRGTLVLKVPSVLAPVEHNFLINPTHPRFAEVKVADPLPFPFDARLLALLGRK